LNFGSFRNQLAVREPQLDKLEVFELSCCKLNHLINEQPCLLILEIVPPPPSMFLVVATLLVYYCFKEKVKKIFILSTCLLQPAQLIVLVNYPSARLFHPVHLLYRIFLDSIAHMLEKVKNILGLIQT
jgi:hypothetical protein